MRCRWRWGGVVLNRCLASVIVCRAESGAGVAQVRATGRDGGVVAGEQEEGEPSRNPVQRPAARNQAHGQEGPEGRAGPPGPQVPPLVEPLPRLSRAHARHRTFVFPPPPLPKRARQLT